MRYLVNGLTDGFHTGLYELPSRPYECKNLQSALQNPEAVDSAIADELQKGYIIGPFKVPPFARYRISPVGVVEKKHSSKKRLIVDLSAPHDKPGDPSINELINKEEFSLSYVKLDDAIRIIAKKGRGALLCKTDIVDAFKLIPIHPTLRPYYGIQWKGQYFFYTRLVFGSRSSPKIFDTLSTAICWIAINNYGIHDFLHLLDDFLAIDGPGTDGDQTMSLILFIFNKLCVPIAPHKTVGPTTELEYLGITLDTNKMEARLPADKLERLMGLVRRFLSKRTCVKRQALSLLGHLTFACRVVIPGRSFISRLLEATRGAKELHHFVTLNQECRKDLLMWHTFLNDWNGVSLFLDNAHTEAPDICLFTDASGTIGYGGYFQGEWFQGTWPKDLESHVEGEASMAFKELVPVVIAATIWGKSWSRKRILFWCDNQATVAILNKGRSRCPDIMRLMRHLALTAAKCSFAFSARYITSQDNNIADSLSRFQNARFRKLAPDAESVPCQVPLKLIFPW